MEATGLLNHTGNRRGAGTGTVEGLGMFKMLVIHSWLSNKSIGAGLLQQIEPRGQRAQAKKLAASFEPLEQGPQARELSSFCFRVALGC